MEKNKILQCINEIKNHETLNNELKDLLIDLLDLRKNKYHPLVFINGTPTIGKNVSIGFFSEINAKGGKVVIGNNCDIASFVSINVADSHLKAIGMKNIIKRGEIVLGNNVFVGSHSFICGNVKIGSNSVVAAGTILIDSENIPPYSLVKGNPAIIYKGHYLSMKQRNSNLSR